MSTDGLLTTPRPCGGEPSSSSNNNTSNTLTALSCGQSSTGADGAGGIASSGSPLSKVVLRQGISVACRVRPLSATESLNPKAHVGVRCLEDSIIFEAPAGKNMGGVGYSKSSTPKDRQFHLDHVFHSHTAQEEVYRTSCQHAVKGLFEGINGSVLAYGSTGSGKTFSMFGSGLSAGGVIYQAVQDIFDEKDRLESLEGKYVAITCTFLEVYNEEVFDLLAKKRQPLAIREDEGNQLSRGGGTVNVEALSIKGLTRAAPSDIVEFDGIIELGRRNRFTASTNANEQSSRSHAIISVEVEVRENESSSVGTIARIRLCDLAGSERASATSNRGLRIREGGNINKSLLALGTVVQALAKRSKLPPSKASEVFVPYRGSKLTRLLRDCLGGNCNTSMLFCVTPSVLGFEENLNTMLFAMQAKLVQVAAKRNEFTVNVAEVARNQENIIERLRFELAIIKEEFMRLSLDVGRGHVDFSTLILSASGAALIEGTDTDQAQTEANKAQDGAGAVQNTDGASRGQGVPTTVPTHDSDHASLNAAVTSLPLNGDGASPAGLVSDSASPQRLRSSSLSSTPMMSPKVVTLVDGGALVIDGSMLSCAAFPPSTPRAPTPTHHGASGSSSMSISMGRARNPSLSPSHTHTHPHHLAASAQEVANAQMCAELRQRLKDITDEKATLHRELQANSDKQASLEFQMRKERMALCELMASMPRGELPNPPPIRVVGQLQAISSAQSRLSELRLAYNDLNIRTDLITSKVNTIGKETLRERTANPVIELLIENASLRFSLLDAEAFASEYNSKLSQAEAKYEEATDALHRCQEVLRELLPIADARDKERERDYERALLVHANGGSGSAAGGGGATIPPQPPTSIGRRCAAALALSSSPDTATDHIMDQFRRVFSKCCAKLSSKIAASSEGTSIGNYEGSFADATTPLRVPRSTSGSALHPSGNKSAQKLAGGGGGGANSNAFSRTLTHVLSSGNLGSLGSGSSAASSGGGTMASSGVSAGAALGGQGGLGGTIGSSSSGGGGSGNYPRLVTSHPQSMLSSHTMRDLRKKAGIVGGSSTNPSRSGAALSAGTSPSNATGGSGGAGGKRGGGGVASQHNDPSDDTLASTWSGVTSEKMRNTSPFKGNRGVAGDGGGGGVGFTVSKANGRLAERAKAPAQSSNGSNTNSSFQRTATAVPSGASSQQGSKEKIIKPRGSKD